MLDDHVTFWFVAFDGAIAAVKLVVFPTVRDALVFDRETPETGIFVTALYTDQSLELNVNMFLSSVGIVKSAVCAPPLLKIIDLYPTSGSMSIA